MKNVFKVLITSLQSENIHLMIQFLKSMPSKILQKYQNNSLNYDKHVDECMKKEVSSCLVQSDVSDFLSKYCLEAVML